MSNKGLSKSPRYVCRHLFHINLCFQHQEFCTPKKAAVLVVGCALIPIISSVFIYLLLDFNRQQLPLLPPTYSIPSSNAK